MFMGSFTKLGKVFDLNRSADMRLIDKVFRKSGDRDRKDAVRYPDGFINVDEPYDKVHHAVRYSFTQCPNAEFAKKHGLRARGVEPKSPLGGSFWLFCALWSCFAPAKRRPQNAK